MGLPAGTAALKRHISITMEFASRTISPVPDITHPPTTSCCARRSWLTAARRWRSMMPPPSRCRPPPRRRRSRCNCDRHLLPRRRWWFKRLRPASGCRLPGFVGRWPVAVGPRGSRTWSGTARASVGARRRDGRLAARCRLARAVRPLGPAEPDALAGP